MNAMTRMECLNLLLTCVDLFQPENSGYYARFSKNGKFTMELAAQIPAVFPQDHKQMYEMCGKIYGAMPSVGLTQQHLEYPNFDEMKERVDTLSFEDCAQFLLFWCRANLRYGQEFFYQIWQEGTVLRVLRRMISQLGSYQFPDERPAVRKYATIQPELGDLAEARVTAVVNPTNTQLYGSGAVERALRQKAAPEMREYCMRCGPIPVGGTAWTSSFGLPAQSIIHVAVPAQGQQGVPYLLAASYANALDRARAGEISTVAFSAMGTGSAGIPAQEALRIGAQAIWNWTRRNPGKPMTIKILFSSQTKLEFFRQELMLCIVREFRAAVDPADLGVELRHSLPAILEECGGMVTLPPERRKVADIGREAFSRLHSRYCELMNALHELIGSPSCASVVADAVKRVAPGGNQKQEEAFLNHLHQMELEECICWLVLQQRLDYASGGTGHTHIRNCSNGNAYRVLGRMEQLLRTD